MVNARAEQSPPRIVVAGDIMIDIDLHCECNRLCQEGPWPVFSIQRTEHRLGGAGNVARMASALGASAMLVGVCDEEQWDLVDHAGLARTFIPAHTTTKIRYWVGNRMVGPRVDSDCSTQPTSQEVDRLMKAVREFDPHAIIVADHGKGFVTQSLMTALRRLHVPIYVDPVPITPMVEGTICIGGEHEQPRSAHSPQGEVIKLGPNGLRWNINGQTGAAESCCRQLVDPLGAGDQFIAALACQRCVGMDWPEAIDWANLAAGMQCERAGCVPLSLQEVEAAFRSHITTA